MKSNTEDRPGFTPMHRINQPLLRAAFIIAVYILAFTILDLITKQFEELKGVVAWYPPAGLTYALLLVFGIRFAPAVTIVLLIDSVFIYKMPQPTYLLFLWALVISVIYSLAAAFLRGRIRFDWHLRKVRDLTWFVFTTVFTSGLLAVLSVVSSAKGSGILQSDVLLAIFHWWIGETVGVLTVTPFLLIFVMPGLKGFIEGRPARLPALRSLRRPTLSAIGQVLSIVLTLYWVFGVNGLDQFHPLYLLVLPLIWIALQRGLKGVSAALLVLNSGVVLALWLFRFDITRLSELELLMIINCIVNLTLGAVVTERKQAVAELSESQERFRSLFENATIGMYRTTPEGNILMANPTLVRMLGYNSFEELSQRGLTSKAYEPRYPRIEFQNRMHRDGEVRGLESAWKRKNGSIIYVRESAHLARDKDDQPLYYEGTVEDITDKKHAEEDLRLLSATEKQITQQETIESTFQLAGKKIQELIGDGYVGVTIINEQEQVMRIIGLYGMGSSYYKLLKRFKVDPTKIAYPLKEMTEDELRLFRSGSLEKFEKGLYSLLVRKVPAKVCSAAEKALKIKGVYTMGFVSHGLHYGGLTILAKRDISPQRSIIETIVNQATLALHRMKVERSLRESEEQLRQVTDSMQDLLVQTDLEGKIHYASPSNKTALGYDLETLPGKSIYDLMHPEDIERVKEFISKPDKAEMTRKQEIRYRHADGHYLWMESAVSIIDDASGTYVGTVFSSRDISERKQASDKLEEERILLRTLIDNLPDRIYVMDTQGRKLISNLADWQASGGKTMEDVIGKTDFDTYPPEMAEEFWALDKEVIDSGKAVINHEEPGLDSQGNPVLVLSSKVPLRDGQGKVTGLVGIGRDITERKRAEETLQKSEKRFKALVENSLEEISLLGADGTLTWESPSQRRPLGYPPNSFVGNSLLEIFHPDDREEATRLLTQIVQTPGSIKEATFRLRHQDGSWRWMEAVVTNLLDEPAVQSIVINYRDVTERKEREDEIRTRNEEISALYRLSRDLGDAIDLKNVIKLVNLHAVESVHVTFACIALLEDGQLTPQAVHTARIVERGIQIGDRQPLADLPICRSILDKNEPIVLKPGEVETSRAERATLMFDYASHECIIPLLVGDPSKHLNRPIGILILGEEREEKREPFTGEKIRLARSIGDQAAAAIHRLLLSDQAGRRLRHLASLSEIDRTIASNFDLRISLQILLKHVIEQLEVDTADVLVFNKYTRTLEYAAGSGFRSTLLEGTRQQMGEGQAGRAVLERQIIQIPNVAASGTEFAHPDLLKDENIVAYFAVPLITKGQVMGVLEICHRTPLEPSEEWIEFLRTLGGQAAIAIDNVNMFESLQKSTDELELAYDATIEGWSRALDLRDKETEGHTQRVTGMTVELARSFGLSEPDLMKVRWGALLHDIGKMGVPDSILLKPGSLTEDEWVVMKKHPELAFEMLSPIRYLQGALDIPYCHHEWWNGSGYPRGLKGEEIPLAARIFAVIDVWDALISDRPYRPAWTKQKALEHIQAGAGTHFDPQVVIKFNSRHA